MTREQQAERFREWPDLCGALAIRYCFPAEQFGCAFGLQSCAFSGQQRRALACWFPPGPSLEHRGSWEKAEAAANVGADHIQKTVLLRGRDSGREARGRRFQHSHQRPRLIAGYRRTSRRRHRAWDFCNRLRHCWPRTFAIHLRRAGPKRSRRPPRNLEPLRRTHGGAARRKRRRRNRHPRSQRR